MGAQAEALYALFDRLGAGGKDFSAILQLLRGQAPASVHAPVIQGI
jgi:3-hydroxyisobutyrate dehydrogenase